ncbi:MAG: hypothetical protein WBW76_06645, partial [Candidatus Cybelea sp.]
PDSILIYLPGKTSPVRKITVPGPFDSAFNKAENLIYVPEGKYGYHEVGVYDYHSGTLVTTISIEGYDAGAALSPAPTP